MMSYNLRFLPYWNIVNWIIKYLFWSCSKNGWDIDTPPIFAKRRTRALGKQLKHAEAAAKAAGIGHS